VPAGAAVDGAGNTSTAAPQLTRTYDATRPAVALSTSATDPTNAASLVVHATFTKPVTGLGLGAIRIDNGTASNLQGSGTSYSFTVSPVEDGVVTIDLAAGSAADGTGNTNTAAPRLSLEVDRTPPIVSITSLAPFLSFAANDPSATFACSLDGGPFVDCTTPFAAGDSADGNHTFEVQATDPAGNSSTASTTWTVGSQAPAKASIAITSAPPAVTPSSSATISFPLPTPTTTVTCRLDGGAYTACATPLRLTGLAAGQHTLDLRAVDATGSVSTAATTWTVATTELHANTNASARRAHAAPRLRQRSGGRGCTIYGTARIVRGTTGDDVICLSPGFHIVYALSGNDIVYGRGGTQIEYGGPGNDTLFGGAGHDYLDGGSGDDHLNGGAGDDKLLGRSGDDVLSGGSGSNRLHGGSGSDRGLWHAGDVVFEIARGPVRVWRKTSLSPDVPLITHFLTYA